MSDAPATPHLIVNPESIAKPIGYANGVLAAPGRTLFLAGQVAWNEQSQIVSSDLAEQLGQIFSNLAAVLEAGGGRPEHLVKMNLFVLDAKEYASRSREIGHAYRACFGKHFPAMTLVQVAGLFEEGAKAEVEAIAVIPEA